jgi:ATP-dependent Clp protease ATP-binding subunit ClpX
LPVVSTLETLNENDMMRVLKEPKNSLVKQYKKLFMLEGVELEFRDTALQEIVRLALDRKAGARALRSVMEEHLLDIMYYLPEMEGVERVIITKETITKGKEPLYKHSQKRKSA